MSKKDPSQDTVTESEPPAAQLPAESPTPSVQPKVDIIHIDEHSVVVNKPSGLLVHRTRESTDTIALLQIVRDMLGHFVYPVHRIDRAASGVVLFGRSSEAAAALHASLGATDARKEYLVLVRGLAPEEGTIDRPLTDRRTGERKPAVSHFKRIAELDRMSLLEVRIETGRRHQIRRHMSSIAHQIIGDTTYGKGRINSALREGFGLPRLCLHARVLDITHPFDAERLISRAAVPEDLIQFLGRVTWKGDSKPTILEELAVGDLV